MDLVHNELGADAFFLYMPLRGVNHQRGYPYLHDWFRKYQDKGDLTLRCALPPLGRTSAGHRGTAPADRPFPRARAPRLP